MDMCRRQKEKDGQKRNLLVPENPERPHGREKEKERWRRKKTKRKNDEKTILQRRTGNEMKNQSDDRMSGWSWGLGVCADMLLTCRHTVATARLCSAAAAQIKK